MTAKQEMAYSIASSNNKGNVLILYPLVRVYERGLKSNPCRPPCSRRLWRRSRWLCNISARVAGCVVVVVSIIFMARALVCFDPAACRFLGCLTLKSACISLSFGFESLLCFLASFFSFTAELEPSFALLFCLRGKSCLALFTPLLKTELALVFVRFWWFPFYSIHNYNNTFLLQKNC